VGRKWSFILHWNSSGNRAVWREGGDDVMAGRCGFFTIYTAKSLFAPIYRMVG